MAIVGYARVSKADGQDLNLQLDALKKEGCTKIFQDKVSGAKVERKGLNDCLATLQSGDTLVLWRIDRLGRSLTHLVSVVEDFKKKGISFKSINDGGVIDTTSASGNFLFAIFAALAEFERDLIRERTKAGLDAARARGRVGGRKPVKVDDSKVITAKKLHKDKTLSINDICKTLQISRATFYRYLKMQ